VREDYQWRRKAFDLAGDKLCIHRPNRLGRASRHVPVKYVVRVAPPSNDHRSASTTRPGFPARVQNLRPTPAIALAFLS
jgi:hypothetical protein